MGICEGDQVVIQHVSDVIPCGKSYIGFWKRIFLKIVDFIFLIPYIFLLVTSIHPTRLWIQLYLCSFLCLIKTRSIECTK
jgi:hypothetical protein